MLSVGIQDIKLSYGSQFQLCYAPWFVESNYREKNEVNAMKIVIAMSLWTIVEHLNCSWGPKFRSMGGNQ